MNRLFLFALALCPSLLLGEARAAATAPSATNDAQAKIRAAVGKVYDLSKLHRIAIVIPQKDVAAIEGRTDARITCTFTFDGVTLQNVGIRQAGGTAHPYVGINNKPSLSVKFNEFTKGQDLFGIEKMILKNELQDNSLVNEHLTYEVYRRAGIAAPVTAHAVVTINGILNGIYLMREPINKAFLVRNFGQGMENGNLYEEDLFSRDVMLSPDRVQLKDADEPGRNRSDLTALANAMRSSTPQTFVAQVGPLFDIERYITYYAVEAVTSHFDGFSMNNNNTYLYHHLKEDRFILIPYGADETFWSGVSLVTRISSPLQLARSTTAMRMRAVPELAEHFAAEVQRVGSPPIWDQQALLGRYEQVARILATTERVGRTSRDLDSFERYRPLIEMFIRAGGTSRGTATFPR